MKHGIRFVIVLSIMLYAGWSIYKTNASQTFQQAAKQWQGSTDQRYCLVSAYWNDGEIDAKQASSIASALEQHVQEEPESAPIAVAYGGFSSGRAAYDKRNAAVELWHISENFFRLHSYAMIEGGIGAYNGDSQIAILSEETAWLLFGSIHCCGENILIDGMGFRIVAVLREPNDGVNRTAYSGTARIFLPLDKDYRITFLEAVLPEYYSGYAAEALADETGADVITNTGRFRLPALWKSAKDFFSKTPKGQPELPPWEQAARLAARRLCILWVILLTSSGIGGFLLTKEVWRLGRRWNAHKTSAQKRTKRLGRYHVAVYALCDDGADQSIGPGSDSGGH